MSQPSPARDRYITLATEGFANHGYHGLSLANLAKTAGVTKQALLHHFGTKDALYNTALEALTDRLLASLNDTPDVSPKLRLILHFQDLLGGETDSTADARLILRNLLDSTTETGVAPLKPYLKALLDLARAVPAKKAATDMELLLGLYGVIGSAQYLLISEDALAAFLRNEDTAAQKSARQKAVAAQLKAFLDAD
ncbi:TetR/AcrR family transcriptional regulator [Shimia sp.]|jgi:AcrR family transcriptional regulator|uniref:TetR/AcrR family transcriptional regulator n=1 Tax=unclassified Shimia TaxID=2630038 RepID=UPI0025D66705|nr:TetR/AcrR family transcriptional regulator [Shimia sp.]MCH2066614.1 TetR/AcrR family transcriptional regulator [Shimia sp.]